MVVAAEGRIKVKIKGKEKGDGEPWNSLYLEMEVTLKLCDYSLIIQHTANVLFFSYGCFFSYY